MRIVPRVFNKKKRDVLVWRYISLLIYPMKNSPAWEANRFSVSQEISLILCDRNVQYSIHVPIACPYPEPSPSSPCPTLDVLKIHLNIILLSELGSSKWSLSLRFPHEDPVYTYFLPHTCYKHRPSPRFNHQKNIGWGIHIINLI